MVKPLAVFCAALFTCLAIGPASARAATPSQPPHFTVRLLTVNGSGCPYGTAAVSAAPDESEFKVTYDQYTASAGDGASPINFRKNCQFNVLVSVPPGWTYGIASQRYRGFVKLGPGARAVIQTSYYFSGLSGTYRQGHPLSGPVSTSYVFDDRPPVIRWVPCHFAGTVNVNTSLQVSRGKNRCFFSEITVNSTDSPHLAFRRC
jgi:uncharacterized protein DUF4360